MKSRKYKWHVLITKIIIVLTLLVINYFKALYLGEAEGSVWKWFSLTLSILITISTILSEIMDLKHFVIKKFIPQKNSSIDTSLPSRKRQRPTQKESTIEIKQIDKKLDTEREDLIKKIESFKTIKVLYVLRNDLELLPLPDQPLKRYSSHYSQGTYFEFYVIFCLDNTNDEVEGLLKQGLDFNDIESKANSSERRNSYTKTSF